MADHSLPLVRQTRNHVHRTDDKFNKHCVWLNNYNQFFAKLNKNCVWLNNYNQFFAKLNKHCVWLNNYNQFFATVVVSISFVKIFLYKLKSCIRIIKSEFEVMTLDIVVNYYFSSVSFVT